MQPAEPPHRVDPRPQIKVVSISEQDLDAQFLKQILRNALDGSQCPHRHEDWCVDLAMWRDQFADATSTAGSLNLKFDGHSGIVDERVVTGALACACRGEVCRRRCDRASMSATGIVRQLLFFNAQCPRCSPVLWALTWDDGSDLGNQACELVQINIPARNDRNNLPRPCAA